MKHLFFKFVRGSKIVFLEQFLSIAWVALGMVAAALCRQSLFFMAGMKRPKEALMTANKKRLCQTSYSEQPARTPILFLFLMLSPFLLAQNQMVDSTKVSLDEIVIQSTRAKGKNPITFTNVNEAELAPRNLGQDIPVLLNYLPSVVTTTDAGTGVGYTYMRVRGSDGSRINVTLNGVPFNDSESQASFFVNLPDFASSLESIQLQRGVGTSTNGPAAFGASLNMQTKSYSKKSFGEISTGLGSFGSQRHQFSFSTGLNNHVEVNARVSKIVSDGFIDRASAQLFGYYLNANYVKDKTLMKFYAFGGQEKTYQAWNGLDQAPIGLLSATNLDFNFSNTFNISGIKTDENGQIEGFHPDEVDNYAQHHFQFYLTHQWSSKWQTNLALHYTKGKGFFEQYVDNYYFTNVLFRNDAQLNFLNLPNIVINNQVVEAMDYVRRRWLNNHFYGSTFSLNYHHNKTQLNFGGAINQYRGLHYGEVIWNEYQIDNIGRYYDNYGNKDEANFYVKWSQDLSKKLNFYTDLQYRMVNYEATSFRFDPVDDTFRFFNPKVGLDYVLNQKSSFYAYFGVSHREPRRDDYENNATKSEQLKDFEGGWRFQSDRMRFNWNGFYMNYKNQLVMTGTLNDVGSPVFANSGSSFRAGFELDVTIKFYDWLTWQGNTSWSLNKNRNFYFERDGVLQNLRQTTIAYSPNVVASSQFQFKFSKNLNLNWLSKYVSRQYMGNIDSEGSILPAFFINDLNITYSVNPKKLFFKTITFNALVNNLFDVKYASNGYFYTYDDDFTNPNQITTIEGIGFYPQAGINVLMGFSLRF